ncbi:RDD family protein [Streptomyces sp. NPDC003077]|uniref:RDD family protein n=1 Tax=Streptomyces sp. NPDC003077 TaxID=3154443 RepID=UPI00339E853F
MSSDQPRPGASGEPPEDDPFRKGPRPPGEPRPSANGSPYGGSGSPREGPPHESAPQDGRQGSPYDGREGSPYDGPPPDGSPYGAPPYDGPAHEGPPRDGTPRDGSPYGGTAYGTGEAGGPPPPPPSGGPPYGQGPYGGGPYGNGPYGGDPYGGSPYGGGPYGGPYGAADPLAGMPPLAHRGRRLVARIIDGLIIGVPVGLIVSLLVGGVDYTSTSSADSGRQATVSGITMLAYLVYEGLMLTSRGQTVGKMIMGIRVAMLDNGAIPTGPAGWVRAAVYTLPEIVPCCGFLFWLVNVLWCTWDKPYQQCLHDKAARTVVVSAA